MNCKSYIYFRDGPMTKWRNRRFTYKLIWKRDWCYCRACLKQFVSLHSANKKSLSFYGKAFLQLVSDQAFNLITGINLYEPFSSFTESAASKSSVNVLSVSFNSLSILIFKPEVSALGVSNGNLSSPITT